MPRYAHLILDFRYATISRTLPKVCFVRIVYPSCLSSNGSARDLIVYRGLVTGN
ncbi:hypothetical protein M378DRAFT_812316 [Amanita muscaria Koide BX008]|uniref:Uncharacterized protein n=1 Tax=Amanita muscaria (strain Koide BX008) TaxID=946122 RepID=A0A0C2T5M1_AMAMK|nr:hypothetical protein M378DRAFT_812316 [Amanita muscaria Koide BX008]